MPFGTTKAGQILYGLSQIVMGNSLIIESVCLWCDQLFVGVTASELATVIYTENMSETAETGNLEKSLSVYCKHYWLNWSCDIMISP